MKNTVIEGTGGPITATSEPQNSSWLGIDQFPDSSHGFEDCGAKDICHVMGNIEDTWRFDGANEGQAEDGFQATYHNVHEAHYGPDKEEEVIADPEMNGIEVNTDGSLSKDGHRADVGGDAGGWCYPCASFISELTSQS